LTSSPERVHGGNICGVEHRECVGNLQHVLGPWLRSRLVAVNMPLAAV
jgi:hypothetical protein